MSFLSNYDTLNTLIWGNRFDNMYASDEYSLKVFVVVQRHKSNRRLTISINFGKYMGWNISNDFVSST